MSSLSLDLGGTIIKGALVRDGAIVASATIAAGSANGLAAQLPRVESLLRGVCDRAEIPVDACAGVGACFPGLIDPHVGRIISAPSDKYADAPGVSLVDWARRTLGLQLKLENDAHAALLGEWRFGAGRGADDLAMITLGTGIGTSLLVRGRPLRGRHFQAGVLCGHLVVSPNGRPCGCPAHGCIEAETGSRAIAELIRTDPAYAGSALAQEPEADYAALFRCAAGGDGLAIRLRDRSLDLWGALCVSLVHAFDLERIVVGGGIMRSGEVILPHLQRFVRDNAWTPWGQVAVVAGELGDNAALLGNTVLLSESLQYL